MKKRSVVCALLAMVLAAGSLVGCGSNNNSDTSSKSATGTSGAQKEVSWATWGNEGELARFNALNEAFMKENPDVKINFISIPSNGYMDKILSMVSSGTEPNIYYVESGYHNLAASGKLENLEPFMENDKNGVTRDNFFPNVLPWFEVDGTLYALPCDTAPITLYYNKDMLSSLGLEDPNDLDAQGKWDINAFEEMAKKITESGKVTLLLDNSDQSQIGWFASSGAEYFNDDATECTIYSDKAVEIYTKVQNMVKNGLIQWNGSGSMDPNGLFMGQQLAFVEAGRWLMPLFKDIKDFEYDICPMPSGLDGGRETAIASVPVVMSANTSDKETAWRFFSYFESEAGQTFRLQDYGNCIPSINLPGLDDTVFMNEPAPAHKELWQKYRSEGRTKYVACSMYPETAQLLKDANDKMFANFEDVDTVLKQLQQDASAAMK